MLPTEMIKLSKEKVFFGQINYFLWLPIFFRFKEMEPSKDVIHRIILKMDDTWKLKDFRKEFDALPTKQRKVGTTFLIG